MIREQWIASQMICDRERYLLRGRVAVDKLWLIMV